MASNNATNDVENIERQASGMMQMLKERQSAHSTGMVRMICGCVGIFFLIVALIDLLWIGGTAKEECEHHFVKPFLVEGYLALAAAIFFLFAVCYPPCGIFGLLLLVAFLVFLFGTGFWKLISCFGYTGWMCREHVFAETQDGSTAWMVCFLFGLIQFIAVWGVAFVF